MSEWTLNEVERLYDAVACYPPKAREHFSESGCRCAERGKFEAKERLDRVKAVFVEGCHARIPQRDRYFTTVYYEGGFNPYCLWEACIASHDAAVLEFLCSRGFAADSGIFDGAFTDVWPSCEPCNLWGRTAWTDFASLVHRELRSNAHRQRFVDWDDLAEFFRIADDLGFLLLGYGEDCREADGRMPAALRQFAKSSARNVAEILIGLMPEESVPFDVLTSLPTSVFNAGDLQTALSRNRVEVARALLSIDPDWGERLWECVWPWCPLCITKGMTMETIVAAEEMGLTFGEVGLSFSRGADAEKLAWASRRNVEIGMDIVSESSMFNLFSYSEERSFAMGRASETLDYETIERLLDNGAPKQINVEAARRAGREDLLRLYESFGIETDMQHEIWDGALFVKNGVFDIPSGVRVIRPGAFENFGMGHVFSQNEKPSSAGDPRSDELVVPPTVEEIGDWAFAYNGFRKVRLPQSVKRVGACAFYGTRFISLYDTVDAEELWTGRLGNPPQYKSNRIDRVHGDDPGSINSNIGWIGVYRVHGFTVGDLRYGDCTIEVRSAKTGLVKYRVYMPLTRCAMKGDRFVYMTNWSYGASFDFSHTDHLFERLRGREAKTRTALNRLGWPVHLSDERRKVFSAYLKRNRAFAVRYCIVDDDAAGLRFLDRLGYIDEKRRDEFTALAVEQECSAEVLYLLRRIGKKAKGGNGERNR